MRWWRSFVTKSGGVGANGIERRVMTDGGGLWRCDMSVRLRNVREIKAARAFVEGMNGGAVQVIVPYLNTDEAPYPFGRPPAPVRHGDGVPFSDGSLYEGDGVEVLTASAVALRAVRMPISVVALGAMIGGEHYTVNHPTKGPHLYVVTRIPEDGGDLHSQPPQREASAAGTPLDFDRPRCVMRLINPDEVMGAIVPPYKSSLTLKFQESLDDVI